MPSCHGLLRIDCQLDGFDLRELSSIADATLEEVAARLELGLATFRPARIVVAAGASSVVEREIRVAPRPAGGGYSVYDWFELLVAHELTHLLVRDRWGLPPALLWEGLAVSLGDDRIRTRLFARSYDAWCRGLVELGALVPLAPLLRGSTYYRHRPDVRVDLQAGSFCGFLLRTRGPQRVRELVAASRRPTSDPANAILDPILLDLLGSDFAALEREWMELLRVEVERDASLVDRLRDRLRAVPPPGRERCDLCFAELAAVDGVVVGGVARCGSAARSSCDAGSSSSAVALDLAE